MYNSISGKISAKLPQLIYLECGGIEYLLHVSDPSINKLPAVGGQAKVYTYLHHREDQFALFGFYDTSERNLFFELIKVSGIGPKQAIKILSGISYDQFLSALEQEDVSALTRIPGLGQKTAQKIILALRGKLASAATVENTVHAEIVESLVNMGFDKKQAAAVINELLQEKPDQKDESALIRDAIVRLSGGGA